MKSELQEIKGQRKTSSSILSSELCQLKETSAHDKKPGRGLEDGSDKKISKETALQLAIVEPKPKSDEILNLKLPKKLSKRTSNKPQSIKSRKSFSDSDEEPLSKFTQNKSVNKTRSKEKKYESKLIAKDTHGDNCGDSVKSFSNNQELKQSSVKLKRECARRPQNYLFTFSSSDEEEQMFLSKKIVNEKKTNTDGDTYLLGLANLDLSSKDLGRRFGKGKVNMSNEEIEQWLQNSANAENHDAVKLGM